MRLLPEKSLPVFAVQQFPLHCCFENKKPFRCKRNGSEGILSIKPLKKTLTYAGNKPMQQVFNCNTFLFHGVTVTNGHRPLE